MSHGEGISLGRTVSACITGLSYFYTSLASSNNIIMSSLGSSLSCRPVAPHRAPARPSQALRQHGRHHTRPRAAQDSPGSAAEDLGNGQAQKDFSPTDSEDTSSSDQLLSVPSTVTGPQSAGEGADTAGTSGLEQGSGPEDQSAELAAVSGDFASKTQALASTPGRRGKVSIRGLLNLQSSGSRTYPA